MPLVVVVVVVAVVILIYLHEKTVEENSKTVKNIYNIICAIPNLHHANKALTEVQNL